jgi:threonine dehydratase
VQQKTAYTRFQSIPRRAPDVCAEPIEPIVSSTSFIGGFSPRPQRLGLFSGHAEALPGDFVGGVAAYDALPQSCPGGEHKGMATSARKNTPKRPLELAGYLQKILTARVYDVAIESALDAAPALSARLGNRIFFKREDTQAVFSFKLRGAYNKMAHLAPAALARGVICASAGNHAQGVALAAQRLGCDALVVMPTTTPSLKVAAVRALGAEVVLFGDSYSDAYAQAMALEKERGLTFVHPFDDPDVIAGQGTVAMEILRQHQGPIDAVFVAVGGGGLISGIAAYIKAVRPEIRVVGVQMNDSDAMIRSIEAGERVELADVGLFSDGTAVKRVGAETFRLARELVDEWIVVDTDAACAAIKDVFEDTRSILEPAGALGVAAIKQYVQAHATRGQTYVAITCGANMNFDRLRFVAERAEVGEEREALFAVTIPEERGSFRRFCELIGPRAVTEFNYRIADAAVAHVFVGVATVDRAESAVLAREFEDHGFATLDLTGDELAKEHERHMDGGRSPLAHDERLYRFVFPERPGALMRFLSSMPATWNISLFHYRNQGADYGRILVGMLVPSADEARFRAFLDGLAYPCADETANPAYRLFLG